MKLDLIGIVTNNFEKQKTFYRDVLKMKIVTEMEFYVEFENSGTRFAISTSDVMLEATGHSSYQDKQSGHAFELAFLVDSPQEVDSKYKEIVEKGAKSIKAPADMPWGQRTAFFADPDGNIHEIFANLK